MYSEVYMYRSTVLVIIAQRRISNNMYKILIKTNCFSDFYWILQTEQLRLDKVCYQIFWSRCLIRPIEC